MAMTTMSREVEDFLGEVITAVVGTKRSDGSVQLNPCWYEYRDGLLWLNSAEGRQWPDHVREEGRVTLFMGDPGNPWRWAQVQGRLVDWTHEGADEHIDRLSLRYTGNPVYQARKEGEQRVILRVAPERITGPVTGS